jgi:serine/threonine protein kinase
VTPPPAPPIQALFPDGYKPIEMLGRGNFAEVWRAEAPGGIAVAVKIVSQALDNEAAQREMKSLELVKKLQHPKLLSTLAYWVIQNRLVIAMELADKTLRDRLKECQAKGLPGIPAEELLSYLRDAAEGLDWLHWQKVLHRDIKPENILLIHGYAKVADFGLAREHMGTLMSVSFAGTPAFMAPEMWGGKANERSDQYSLAFMYAELRLGRRPLEGGDFLQVMNSAQNDTPDLTGLSEAEQTVVHRALAKRPEERFDSCVDFVEALERALRPDGRASRRRPTPEPARGRQAAQESSTERTQRPLEKPVKALDSNDKTYAQGTLPKPPAVVWKPPGPKQPEGGTAKIILVVLVGVLLLAGGAVVAYMVWPRPNGSTSVASTEMPTAPRTEPPPRTTKPVVTNHANDVPPPIVPPRFVAGDLKDVFSYGGQRYPKRIVFRKDQPGEAAFLLLQPENGPPFYLAENKASNALFKAFREEGGGGPTAWTDDAPDLPALNVTRAEAEACAKWLGGTLPASDQLDFAAGLTHRDGRAGPAEGKEAAVKLNRPLPVNRNDRLDISPLGIRDLGGNGREWTSDELLAKNGEKLAVLRGRMYTLSTPLTYAQLDRERGDPSFTQVQRPNVASPQTGFRVVIPIK